MHYFPQIFDPEVQTKGTTTPVKQVVCVRGVTNDPTMTPSGTPAGRTIRQNGSGLT